MRVIVDQSGQWESQSNGKGIAIVIGKIALIVGIAARRPNSYWDSRQIIQNYCKPNNNQCYIFVLVHDKGREIELIWIIKKLYSEANYTVCTI